MSCDDCTVMVEEIIIIIMHVQMASEACLSQCVDIMIIVLIRDAPRTKSAAFFNIVQKTVVATKFDKIMRKSVETMTKSP